MNLTSIHGLTDRAARRRAQDWFDRFEDAHPGDPAARAAARDQLEGHLIEALNADPAATADQLDAALARLGSPEDIAAEWSGAAPASAPAGTWARLGVAGASLARGAAVIVALLMVGAVFARLQDPGSVGVFVLADDTWLVGTANGQIVIRDVLGPWTVPACLALALTLLGGASAGLGVWSAIGRWFNRRRFSPFS